MPGIRAAARANATLLPSSINTCRDTVKALIYLVIGSFADETTENIYHGVRSKKAAKLPPDIVKVALRKLDMINAAAKLDDLKVPPSNRLEKLSGDLAGFHSIRVNDQFRVVFQWNDGVATKVSITDYH